MNDLLDYLDPGIEYTLDTDASADGVGLAPSQEQDGLSNIVAKFSLPQNPFAV